MEKKTQKKGTAKDRTSTTTRARSAGTARSGSDGSDGKMTSKKSTAETSRGEEGVKGSLLGKFFLDELKDIYWAEKHLVKALGKMAKEATTEELKQAFEDHRTETEDQVTRLEEIFDMLGEKPVAKKCDAIDGITKEVEGIIDETQDDTFTRDVALIIGGQKAEHYEIATYGGLAQLAIVLGYDDAAELLLQTLDEEKAADSTLTSIAENTINEEAVAE